MTGEQFLNSIRYLDHEINALDAQRVQLNDQRLDILDRAYPGAGLGAKVQHSVGSRTEALGVQLADLRTPEEVCRRVEQLQHQVNKKIDELVDRKRMALEVIERIPDARHRALLIHRFINNYKWSTVADLMGYTQDWVEMRLKREAINAYERATNR